MKPSMRVLAFAALCLLSFMLSAAPVVDRQQRASEAQEKLEYEVSVTLKLVQVHVGDRKGKPVANLSPADFAIRDNGEVRSIVHFEKHILSSPEPARPVEPSAGPAVEPKLNRKIMFFFDFAFNDLAGIMKSKRAALDFIDTQGGPDDEFAVISYRDHKGLTLHEYLTTDKVRIRRFIESFGAKEVTGRAAEVGSEYSQDQAQLDAALGVNPETIAKQQEYVERTYETQVADFLSSLSELAKALRYVPGTKNFILFSSGIANFVLYGSEKYETSFSERYGNPILRGRYAALGRELAASNCSVYAVNVRGLGTSHRKDRDLLGDLSLGQLAKDTGGKYFDNIVEHEAINEEIQELTGAYYVLGYYVDEKWDGKFHRIEIEVKRKGCQILGQTGYFNPKPFSEYSAEEKLFHLLDLALSDKSHLQEAFELPVMVLPYEVKAEVGVLIMAKVPLKIREEMDGAKAECITLVFNKQNEVVAFLRREIDKRTPSAADAFIWSSVLLSPGEYDCRVVLRDMRTGRGARGSSPVAAHGGTQSGVILFPFLLLRPGAASFLHEDKGKPGKELEGASLSDIYPFDRAGYCPVIGAIETKTPSLFALVRCQMAGPLKPAMAFSSYVSPGSSGEKTPVSTRIIRRYDQDGAQVYFLELKIGELRPGPWSITIVAEETEGRQKAATSRDFIVEYPL